MVKEIGYYDILGVKFIVIVDEIKKVYRKLVFKYYFDKNLDELEKVRLSMSLGVSICLILV